MLEKLRLLTWVSMIAVASGCTTFDPVNVDSGNKPVEELNIGDVVKIVTLSGEQYLLKLRGIDDFYLYDANDRVTINQIATIEKKEPTQFGKAAGYAGVALIVLGVIYALDAVVAESGESLLD